MSARDASIASGHLRARPAWRTYTAAAAILATALALRVAMTPALGDSTPFATVLLAVLFTTYIGGWRPALLTAVAGYAAGIFLFVPPYRAFKSWLALGPVRLLIFAACCAAIIWLVSHLRRARQRHAAAEERVSATLESMHEAHLAVDADWRVTRANRSAESLLARHRDEIVGRPLWEVFPRLPGTPAEHTLRAAARQAANVRFETDRLAPSGWHAVNAVPLERGLSLFVHDISVTKAHIGQLEHLVGERTAALQALVAELEAFSYTLVHDIRAPLRSISSFAELIALDHAGQLDVDGRNYLERIRKSAARMDRLITAIMNYSQLARVKPELRPVDLQLMVQDILDSDPALHRDRADVVIVGVLPVVRGNEALLTQCFFNLLHNAIKFVAPGVRPRVRISAQVGGGLARVDVCDNGIGIPADAVQRVFEPFRREHPAYDGSGIGLAIVRKVVELMDGRIGLESTVGAGSRFRLELPLPAASTTSAPQPGPGGGATA